MKVYRFIRQLVFFSIRKLSVDCNSIVNKTSKYCNFLTCISESKGLCQNSYFKHRKRSLFSSLELLKVCVTSHTMPFYAVAKGNSTGVFESWPECQNQITGFKGAVYKKFLTLDEAQQFVQERSSGIVDKRKNVSQSSKKEEPNLSDESKPSRSMSPSLQEMKLEMKTLQKQLSSLRDKFDEYVAQKGNCSSGQSSGTKRKMDEKSDDKPKKTKMIDESSRSKKFAVDDDGFLIVYTDGSCHCNGRQGAQAGVGVYFGPNHPMNVSEPVKGRATNNTAEIQAAIYAAELAKAAGFDKVKINTDSQFVISCMTSWIGGWKKSDWKKRDGSPVLNKTDLIDLDKATDDLQIKWNHVKGHDGIEGNEQADRLARDGAKRYKSEEGEK